MTSLRTIAVTNESTVVSDDDLAAGLVALQYQANYHFRPFWDAGCKFFRIPAGSDFPSGMWQLSILDDSDQAGALGYHDVTEDGQPLLKVFAKTDLDYGLSWTVTTSHEILEALADPECVRGMQVDDERWYALEVGDPVESDEFAYLIKTKAAPEGVLVSDFILPVWFDAANVAGVKYDYARHCTEPLQVLSGGYQLIYVAGKGWTQVVNYGERVEETEAVTEEGRLRPRPSQDLRHELAAG